MPMNDMIRRKRKELGLTQEQTAEYLGVSVPAVSKWESGATCPDLALLPALARLLKTDPNTLLCFQEEPSQQEIIRFCQEISEMLKEKGINQPGIAKALAIMEEKIQEYPRCMSMIHTFALTLDGTLVMSALTPEEKRPYEEYVLSWYRKVAGEADEMLKTRATFMLASKYMHRKEYDQAQEMIDLLPEPNVLDQELLQADLYTMREQLPEASRLVQKKLLHTATNLMGMLSRLVSIELAAENTEKAEQIARLSGQAAAILMPGTYFGYLSDLDVALFKKDTEKSIQLLEAILSSIPDLWNLHGCPLYDQLADTLDTSQNTASILPPLLTHMEQDPEYGFLRENEHFQKMLQKYKK